MRFIFLQHRLLLLLMIVASIFSLGSTGFVYLLPVVGERILKVDSVALGWLWSSLSLGILGTTAWLFWKQQANICHRMWIAAIGAAIGGGAVLVLPGNRSIIVAAVLIALVGGSSGLITPLVSASLQERTPKTLLARVFGVFNTGTMACAVIGMTLFGWAADAFGPATSLIAIGSVELGAAALTITLLPWCRQLATESHVHSTPRLHRRAS